MELDALFALGSAMSPIVNMFFVDEVNSCGGFGLSIIGCADQPGNNMVVENLPGITPPAPSNQAELNVHELGHNLGLPHNDVDPDNIMSTGAFGNILFTQTQIDTILMSELVQGPANMRFIEITPILISAVPVPSAILLFGTGLAGLFGWRWWSIKPV